MFNFFKRKMNKSDDSGVGDLNSTKETENENLENDDLDTDSLVIDESETENETPTETENLQREKLS